MAPHSTGGAGVHRPRWVVAIVLVARAHLAANAIELPGFLCPLPTGSLRPISGMRWVFPQLLNGESLALRGSLPLDWLFLRLWRSQLRFGFHFDGSFLGIQLVPDGVDWIPPHVRTAGDHSNVANGAMEIMLLAIRSTEKLETVSRAATESNRAREG